MLRGDGGGVANRIHRLHGKQRVVVNQVVQCTGPQCHAGDNFEWFTGLAGTGQAAVLQQRNEGIGNDVGVHPQVLAICQVLQCLVRHLAQTDLQGGAVFNDAGNVAGNALHTFFLNRNTLQFGDRGADRHKAVDAADVQGRVPHGARHGGVDLGNDQARARHRSGNDVDRDPQTYVAKCVG